MQEFYRSQIKHQVIDLYETSSSDPGNVILHILKHSRNTLVSDYDKTTELITFKN